VTIGDQDDMHSRLIAALPPWFAGTSKNDNNPIIYAVMYGVAYGYAFIYSLITCARRQMRLATMTDGWLDVFAWDFFGDTLRRAQSQNDDSFRASIRALLLRKRCTRQAMVDVIEYVYGVTPAIYEPGDTISSTSGYFLSTDPTVTPISYGSTVLPYEAFIDLVFHGPVGGPTGWGGYIGGWGVGAIEWSSSGSS